MNVDKKVNKTQLQGFIREYLRVFGRLTSDFSEENRRLFFPRFLLSPYKILGIISATHGLSIEFVEEARKHSLKIKETGKLIEEEVLPQTLSRWVLFSVGGRNNSIANMSLITKEFKEFCDTNNLSIAGGTNIIASKPDAGFIEVVEGGDVRFVDVRFHAVVNERPVQKDTKCLWIFGSNLAKDFSAVTAKGRAKEDFNWFLYSPILGLPKFLPQEEKHTKLEALSAKLEEFQALINLPGVKEPELQEFFEENKQFLCFGGKYKEIYPQKCLSRQGKPDLKPDFLLERSTDDYCDILDIKLPTERIIVGSPNRRRFSSHVESAIAQVDDYKEYFDDPGNREWVNAKYGIKVYKPDVIVLIGKTENIDQQERIKVSQRHPFIQIITFEDIISQTEEILWFFKNE